MINSLSVSLVMGEHLPNNNYHKADNYSEDFGDNLKTSNDNKIAHRGMTVYYKGVPLEEWSEKDPKYTDPKTGVSWYVRDGKYPYFIGDDEKKLCEICKESGESLIMKMGEITGLMQKLDDKTMAYVNLNEINIRSKDGKALTIDTSGVSYDVLMDMFKNIDKHGDYFSRKYWKDNIDMANKRSIENKNRIEEKIMKYM